MYRQVAAGGDGPTEYNGATMVFIQTAAPTGWIKVTTFNDFALRIVSGTVGSGGTQNFSDVFKSHSSTVNSSISTSTQFILDPMTLATTQIPSHTHSNNGSYNFGTTPARAAGGPVFARTPVAGGPGNAQPAPGGTHNHTQPIASVADTITGDSLNMSIRYLDSILATYPV